MRIRTLLLVSCFVLSTAVCGGGSPVLAEAWIHNGQLTGWAAWSEDAADEISGGLRFVPEFRSSRSLSGGREMDGLLSLNGFATVPQGESDLDLYRLWVRYAGPSWELRGGLQKINFGPARILRSLMWFDRLDARDPLGLTDGVYGLLYRRYALDNSSLWLWGLYGNDERKGLELTASEKDEAELGGRYQFPVPRGEMALSCHQRQVSAAAWRSAHPLLPLTDGREQRVALDGVWDIGPGVWFEAAASKLSVTGDTDFWQEYCTVGADYTFDYGPGIHWLVEHFVASTGPGFGTQDNRGRITAVSADLSVAMLDTLTAIGYYDWNATRMYSYLGWQRALDEWLVHVSVFESMDGGTAGSGGDFSGRGLRLMFTYNY